MRVSISQRTHSVPTMLFQSTSVSETELRQLMAGSAQFESSDARKRSHPETGQQPPELHSPTIHCHSEHARAARVRNLLLLLLCSQDDDDDADKHS
jgi:hypothetical protein